MIFSFKISNLINPNIIDNLTILGIGSFKDYYKYIVDNGVIINLSRMSCEGRGISDKEIVGRPLKKCLPKDFLKFTLEAEKVLAF